MGIVSKKLTSQVDKKHIGNLGEEIVVRHLLSKGFTIVEKNFLIRGSEIDIVARKLDSAFLCEVKTVRKKPIKIYIESGKYVSRETYPIWQNITKKKIENMKKAVSQLIRKHPNLRETNIRFFGFIVTLDTSSKKAEINIVADLNI